MDATRPVVIETRLKPVFLYKYIDANKWDAPPNPVFNSLYCSMFSKSQVLVNIAVKKRK